MFQGFQDCSSPAAHLGEWTRMPSCACKMCSKCVFSISKSLVMVPDMVHAKLVTWSLVPPLNKIQLLGETCHG